MRSMPRFFFIFPVLPAVDACASAPLSQPAPRQDQFTILQQQLIELQKALLDTITTCDPSHAIIETPAEKSNMLKKHNGA